MDYHIKVIFLPRVIPWDPTTPPLPFNLNGKYWNYKIDSSSIKDLHYLSLMNFDFLHNIYGLLLLKNDVNPLIAIATNANTKEIISFKSISSIAVKYHPFF